MTNHFSGYDAAIDSTTETRWGELLRGFADANIHQTWSEGAICLGERKLSHLVIKREGEVIGMAQIGIKQFPIIGTGIATVYWGPMWRRKGRPADYTVLDK